MMTIQPKIIIYNRGDETAFILLRLGFYYIIGMLPLRYAMGPYVVN